jgi:hypothetical protein
MCCPYFLAKGIWKRDMIELFTLKWSAALSRFGDVTSLILGKITLSRELEKRRSLGA